MDRSILLEGLWRAVHLIFTGDARVYEAAFVSLWVACVATIIASSIGLPIGFLVAVKRFRGRDTVVTLLNTLLALPTVVVGLFVYALIRRGEVMGRFDLLFSPWAMVMGQVILALPLVAALCQSAISSLDPAAHETALLLGASPRRVLATTAWEARHGLLAAFAAAGGRLVGEVGVSMMLGGNIEHHTRSLTTAIALETSKGEFSVAMALGIVLLTLALLMNFLLRRLRMRNEVAR